MEKKTKKEGHSSNEELSDHDSEYERSKKKTPREVTSDDDEETPRKKKKRSYKKKPVSAGDYYSDSNWLEGCLTNHGQGLVYWCCSISWLGTKI